MDTISRLFQLVRMRGTAYFGKRMTPPWGVEVPEHEALCRFHLVVAGQTWITVPATDSRGLLSAGDFAIVPHGRTHILSDSEGREVTGQEQIPQPGTTNRGPLRVDKPGPNDAILMCGYFRYAQGTPLTLVAQLPDLLVAKDSRQDTGAYINPFIEIATAELENLGAGSELVLDRLTEILFVHAVRKWVGEAVLADGVLNGLADDRLQRVIATIHDQPQEPWTVESLARIAGQSRTAFATHFRAATGFSPIEYLGRWRIELARRMLADTNLQLGEIARRIGYSDPNALTRAFGRMTGCSPSAYRQSSR